MNYWRRSSMNLTSFVFLAFCFITLIIYFIVPKKIQWIILLLSSLVFLFYDNFSLFTVFQALLILLVSYFGGRLIEKYRDTKKETVILLCSIAIILGLLIYLKYSNLLIITYNHIITLLGMSKKVELVTRVSLIGISYYSLIMISYLIDIHRGACKAQKNILKCALFMYYFPILPSGPFVRYETMEKELYKKHKFDYDRMCSGLVRMCWGFFKILVISSRVGYFVDTVYGNMSKFKGFFAILAALFFPLQLYTNFSGSIDVIMGVSEILGINLPENFTGPFFSRTITEFWRNWHITLGAWLKDYIFYPLLKSNFMQKLNKVCKKKFGKNGKKIPLYLSMFVMWLAIGIWHGGAYTYIIGSGMIPFACIFFEDNLAPLAKKINKKLRIDEDGFWYHLYQSVRTYVLFSFAMIFFRASSIMQGLRLIKRMLVFNPWVLLDNKTLYTAGLDMRDFHVMILSVIVLFIVDYFSKKINVREKLFKQNIIVRWAAIYILLFSIIIFGCYGLGYDATSFIYQGF